MGSVHGLCTQPRRHLAACGKGSLLWIPPCLCLLPPVRLLIELTLLVDAGGISALVPSRAPTVPSAASVALDCFSPCWLLLQTKSPRTRLADPQLLLSKRKTPEEAQTSVHSAPAVLIGSFLNLSCDLGTEVSSWYLPAPGLASGEMAWQRLG